MLKAWLLHCPDKVKMAVATLSHAIANCAARPLPFHYVMTSNFTLNHVPSGGDMTFKKVMTGTLALLLMALLAASSLIAQSLVSGDLAGTVTDPSGAVVAGATVNLKNNATGQTRTATTNSSGNYRFSLLPPGPYMVTVTASGFSKSQTTVNVSIGQASVADVKMAVGTASQTVEVTSLAPLVADEENAVSCRPTSTRTWSPICQMAVTILPSWRRPPPAST